MNWETQFFSSRNSGKQTPKWDSNVGAVNTDYVFTNYSVKDEKLTQASSGLKWDDPYSSSLCSI